MAKIAIRKNFTDKNQKPWFNNMNIENAEFMWRPNFRGLCNTEQTKYNRDHERYFGVKLAGRNLDRAMDENWDVKHADEFINEDGVVYPESYYVEVKVRFDSSRPPKIFVTKNGVIKATYDYLDEALMERLDKERIIDMSVVINPYTYWSDMYECYRTRAFLSQLYVEFKEDDSTFGGKYTYEEPYHQEELPFN